MASKWRSIGITDDLIGMTFTAGLIAAGHTEKEVQEILREAGVEWQRMSEANRVARIAREMVLEDCLPPDVVASVLIDQRPNHAAAIRRAVNEAATQVQVASS